MDLRDQKLLDRQIGNITPTRPNEGVMALAISLVFVAGMTLGGYIAASEQPGLHVSGNAAARLPPPETQDSFPR